MKSQQMREQRGDFTKYLRGHGIDVGCGPDPLQVKRGSVRPWDLPQGDAQLLAGVHDNSLEFLYSSHCLEHLVDVPSALQNWSRVVKRGGFVYFVVPEYVLYEKMQWPSVFNSDHKHSFSVFLTRAKVARDNHWHVDDVSTAMKSVGLRVVSASLEDLSYDYSLPPHIDQTRSGSLAQICFIGERL